MTRAEVAPSSVAEAQRDKHSRTLPGPASGPNKDGASAPDGASALGNELGGERDARRELAAARREGEDVPPPPASNTASDLGFGQLNGAEQGVATPGAEKRDQMQTSRNSEMHKDQPDLRKIAQSSSASAAHNPTTGSAQLHSTGHSRPEDLLDTVQRSTGTESGTGAAGAKSGAGVEVGRDAATNNVV
ncbi:uncharacterized protein PFL1_06424 [Pseudozyma flocculosa PF-1]|uniref:Uncharacterized protein n=2 Tax=Pseudozyma flocculosa TaxID=84751 RepID=A0A5C3EXB1_9BASI|nr:uncharacterized protein PFL1_06424 [Pseudozyma flocculosa PF-1]EPQ25969.1 hypothetical protein PFL1_06424 [Pseudozyma flocculosa PF-1]SPO35731.1 uncharacterized protein PSFLO_01202 [Pseudozyma flocculosa]